MRELAVTLFIIRHFIGIRKLPSVSSLKRRHPSARREWPGWAALALLCALGQTRSFAQAADRRGRTYSAADYAHAERLMDYNVDPLVYHTVRDPQWLEPLRVAHRVVDERIDVVIHQALGVCVVRCAVCAATTICRLRKRPSLPQGAKQRQRGPSWPVSSCRRVPPLQRTHARQLPYPNEMSDDKQRNSQLSHHTLRWPHGPSRILFCQSCCWRRSPLSTDKMRHRPTCLRPPKWRGTAKRLLSARTSIRRRL